MQNKKTFIKASGTNNIAVSNNIHTWETGFYSCYFRRFVRPIFSDRGETLVVSFDMYESSLHF